MALIREPVKNCHQGIEGQTRPEDGDGSEQKLLNLVIELLTEGQHYKIALALHTDDKFISYLNYNCKCTSINHLIKLTHMTTFTSIINTLG